MLGTGLPGDPSRGIVRELRRQSDPLRAQHLWDAIRAVRLQKQIPAIPRMGRYMHRYHGLTNDATQRLLDLAIEDNLIKVFKLFNLETYRTTAPPFTYPPAVLPFRICIFTTFSYQPSYPFL